MSRGASIIDIPEPDWSQVPRRVDGFVVDVGFEVSAVVPHWMLPAGSGDGPRVAIPGPPMLEVHSSHAMSRHVKGREAELCAYYRRLPPLPPPDRRAETERYNCFQVDVVFERPPDFHAVADCFGGGHLAADELLAALADLDAPPCVAYDNLDQGWALTVRIEAEDVLVMDWNWDDADPAATMRPLRLARDAVAQQAIAARCRLRCIHALLMAEVGIDLWRAGTR